MGSNRMPISLLRNKKTTGYLEAMFEIIRSHGSKPEYEILQKKVTKWLEVGSPNRLDLNEKESDLLEECSHSAYRIVSAKKELSVPEKVFVEQHEFFFKN